MADSLAAVVLGAGHGTRLRPLTDRLPKVLCPVAGRPLVDWCLDRAEAVVGAGADRVAVNASHLAWMLAGHVATRAHVSVEHGAPLGTGGAIARLRPWLDGRPVLVLNGDTWSDAEVLPHVATWDRVRARLLLDRPRPGSRVVGCLLPAEAVAALPAGASSLERVCWWPLEEAGRLDTVVVPGRTVACDRPRDYLAANLQVSGGRSVVPPGALVEGDVVRSVLWPDAVVARGERLVDAIRLDARLTVLVR